LGWRECACENFGACCEVGRNSPQSRRYSGADCYYYMLYNTTTDYALFEKIVAGTTTRLATVATTLATLTKYKIEIYIDYINHTIKVWRDDILEIDISDTDIVNCDKIQFYTYFVDYGTDYARYMFPTVICYE